MKMNEAIEMVQNARDRAERERYASYRRWMHCDLEGYDTSEAESEMEFNKGRVAALDFVLASLTA